MDITLADQYYLKALDNYSYNLEEVVENLNYALSYDDEHASANCLLGQVFMYQLKKFDTAGDCFYKALATDISHIDTYKHYSLLRIWQGEYERAEKIINRGLKVKGMNKGILFQHKAIIHEWKGELSVARRILKNVKLFSIEKHTIDKIDTDLLRVKLKIKVLNKSKSN